MSLENNDKIANLAEQPCPAPLERGVLIPASNGEKPFVSFGRRVHNELTYRGVDWLVNSAIGVAFAYWTARTKHGQQCFGEPVSWFGKKILSPVLKSEAALNEGAKWFTTFASIMAGGTAIIPVMQVCEKPENKEYFSRTFDTWWYGADVVKNDPRFEASYRCIYDEPKKDFSTGMAARFIAIAPLITVASIPATNKPLIKYLYDPIGNMSKRAAEGIGIKPGKMLTEGAMELLDGDPKSIPQFQSNWDFLHRTIGFDFGLTVFYCMLHEMAFKALAQRKHDKLNGKAKHGSETPEPEVNISQIQSLNHGAAQSPA